MKFEPWTYAFRLLGRRVQRLLPHFGDLHSDIRKSGLRITIAAYLSLMILVSTIIFFVSMTVFPFAFSFIFRASIFSTGVLVLSLLFSGLAWITSFIILYIYPGIMTSNRKMPIDVNLPYIMSFLTLLSSSNVPPRTIFRDLATIDTLAEVRQDFNNIYRDVEIFGADLLTSITNNMDYMPSESLRETLIGYVATIRTGGNPTEYLKVATENIMRERLVRLDLMLESLAAISEIYIMILVAMPLLFVVMFTTLGMLGGGGTGGLNMTLLLYLLSYAFIPIMAAILILVISTYEVK